MKDFDAAKIAFLKKSCEKILTFHSRKGVFTASQLLNTENFTPTKKQAMKKCILLFINTLDFYFFRHNFY